LLRTTFAMFLSGMLSVISQISNSLMGKSSVGLSTSNR
jgi:hypothetical protein